MPDNTVIVPSSNIDMRTDFGKLSDGCIFGTFENCATPDYCIDFCWREAHSGYKLTHQILFHYMMGRVIIYLWNFVVKVSLISNSSEQMLLWRTESLLRVTEPGWSESISRTHVPSCIDRNAENWTDGLSVRKSRFVCRTECVVEFEKYYFSGFNRLNTIFQFWFVRWPATMTF